MRTFQVVVNQIKLLILIILDLIHRTKKHFLYLTTRKHEVQRICELEVDLYERCMLMDDWLSRTHCYPIKNFMAIISKCDMPEAGDSQPHVDVAQLTEQLIKLVEREKRIRVSVGKQREFLRKILTRIVAYRCTIALAGHLASVKYNSAQREHTEMLMSLWNCLVRDDERLQKLQPPPQSRQSSSKNQASEGTSESRVFPGRWSHEVNDLEDLVSRRWSHIGFQGEDPSTDFRGMGVLGLMQLEYLSRRPRRLALDLLRRSLDKQHYYPFAVVGINITYHLLNLFRDGSFKHLYYDDTLELVSSVRGPTSKPKTSPNKKSNQSAVDLINTFNDLYVELFLRFDCYWHESKPETIFQFKPLMERFIEVLQLDLCNRSFSLKFIY